MTERMVYGSNHEGTFEVYAFDWRDGIERRLTSRPAGTGFRVPARITPDGESVWWWDDAGGSEFGTWRVQPFSGGESRPATGLAPAYSAWTALGRGFAIVGRSTDAEGTTIDLVRDGSACRLYAHRESARVGALSRDETLFAMTHSEHGDARNPAVRILDLTGAVVAELWDGPGRGLDPGRWSPVRGDQRLIVHHDRTGSRRPVIFDALARAERDVTTDLLGEVEADWYPDARSLLLRHEHRGRGELYRFELDGSSLERLPTPPGSVGWAAVRPAGTVWLALTTSERPREIRSLDGSGHVLPRMRPDVPSGRPYRDLDVSGIHGFVVEPEGARPHPTIFVVHGGPTAHDTDAFSATVQAWVDHGYCVAMVNYRGSTGYGKAWRDAIKGKPGLTELVDIALVHDRLIADGVCDPKRTIMSGGSWGGYLTLLGLGTQPRRWALGIARVPIGDYVAAFEDEMEPLKRFDAALFGGTPAEVPEVYRERNPITFVDRVRVPALLLVGRNDPRCPARSADLYVERLRALGKTFELYQYEAGHGSLRLDEQLRQLEAQLAFAARHLGTTPPIA